MKKLLSVALVALAGCSSLTPERVNVLAGIAGQATSSGVSDWLAKHPKHRQAFENALIPLQQIQRSGNTNEQALEDAFVQFLGSLPTDAFSGPDGALYVTGASTNVLRSTHGGLVVFDKKLNKSVAVHGAATLPVVKATLSGLKRAMLPKPPALIALNKPKYLELDPPKPTLNAAPPAMALPLATTKEHVNSIMYSTPQAGGTAISLHWMQDGNALYHIEQHTNGAPWIYVAYSQNTNTIAVPVIWQVLWPGPLGEWRVVRVK